MTEEAQDAVANSISFEAKKDSSKQLQSGHWTLTLKLHPDQVSQALMLAAPGQRYMAVLVAIGDDEQAIPPSRTPTTNAEKPKTRWDDMLPQSQIGIALGDAAFIDWFHENHPGAAKSDVEGVIKHLCGVSRKRDLETNSDGRKIWQGMYARYRAATYETAEIRS